MTAPAFEPANIDLFAFEHVHLVGIKGTGMAALAEILRSRSTSISGSDVADRFYTDDILDQIDVRPALGFDASHVPPETDLVIRSAAYGNDNPEIVAAERRGIPVLSYAEALGTLSRIAPSFAVAGVHGKTTTAALAGAMIQSASIPATVFVGSAVADFGNRAVLHRGDRFFVAETCEYRRHFLAFSPSVLLITSVEGDHQDYFTSDRDVAAAFVEFARRLPEEGVLIYCADDGGAAEVARQVRSERPGVTLMSYGRTGIADAVISDLPSTTGKSRFSISGFAGEWSTRIPGEHTVLNIAGAAMGVRELVGDTAVDWDAARRGVERFAGVKRRSEVVGEFRGVLVLDDYAHHPTAIETTLRGYRSFYPGRRIVVDFMSHTYSRTRALFERFARAFSDADVVIVNEIYASAREHSDKEPTGKELTQAIAKHHRSATFEPDFDAAAKFAVSLLHRGDVFVTMGAGDNFRIGQRVAKMLQERT